MAPTTSRRTAAPAAALALAAVLAGCGWAGADDVDAGGPASPGASAAAFDPADPGEDLLDPVRQGASLPGISPKLVWRFPATYTTRDGRQATSSQDGVDYEISVGSSRGTRQDAAEELRAVAERDDPQVTEETVRTKEVTVVTVDAPDGSVRGVFWTPRGTDATVAVLFRATASLADTPTERVQGLYQTVGDLWWVNQEAP